MASSFSRRELLGGMGSGVLGIVGWFMPVAGRTEPVAGQRKSRTLSPLGTATTLIYDAARVPFRKPGAQEKE
jgi:hypothetical protein